MLSLSPMREAQELARTRWTEQEAQAAAAEPPAERETLKKLVHRLRKENRARKIPWPVCRQCRLPTEPENDMHWLFVRSCDSHGAARLEKLVRRIVRSLGRKAAIRALKRLAAK